MLIFCNKYGWSRQGMCLLCLKKNEPKEEPVRQQDNRFEPAYAHLKNILGVKDG